MPWNCGAGEDSWEFPGQTSQSQRKSILNTWKDWCWIWNSSTLVIWCKQLTHWKVPDAGKDWGQKEKRVSEDEMTGWHHWYNEHELAKILGDDEGHEAWKAAIHGVARVGHNWMTEQQQPSTFSSVKMPNFLLLESSNDCKILIYSSLQN